jgi:hypothetical protein
MFWLGYNVRWSLGLLIVHNFCSDHEKLHHLVSFPKHAALMPRPNCIQLKIRNSRYSVEHYYCSGRRECEEPAISLHSHHVSLVQRTTRLLPVIRDPGSKPLGDLSETGILLLALSLYIGHPNVIDHFCGLV